MQALQELVKKGFTRTGNTAWWYSHGLYAGRYVLWPRSASFSFSLATVIAKYRQCTPQEVLFFFVDKDKIHNLVRVTGLIYVAIITYLQFC